jgi:hypothetical protein
MKSLFLKIILKIVLFLTCGGILFTISFCSRNAFDQQNSKFNITEKIDETYDDFGCEARVDNISFKYLIFFFPFILLIFSETFQ